MHLHSRLNTWLQWIGQTWWRHQMETFSRYWPFLRGIHRSSVNSSHKSHWRGALIFCFICAWINAWVSNREAGDLRRRGAQHDVITMDNCKTRGWTYTFWDLVHLILRVCRATMTTKSTKPNSHTHTHTTRIWNPPNTKSDVVNNIHFFKNGRSQSRFTRVVIALTYFKWLCWSRVLMEFCFIVIFVYINFILSDFWNFK